MLRIFPMSCSDFEIHTLACLLASPFVNFPLLWLQAACQLFVVFHLPSRWDLPSIQIESRPARLVMAVTDF
jgi:hypothetical protein